MILLPKSTMSNITGNKDVTLRIQNILEKVPTGKEPTQEQDETESSSSEDEKSSAPKNVRGMRPGNRFWKKERKRFSSVVATRGLRRITWDDKEKLRRELKHAKELTRTLKEERARAKQELRERRKENLKRREENARKAEIVQVIKNSAKLKRLKKKQLRSIEKRDTSGMV